MGYRTTNGNSNTVFRAVKESIRTDDAARHYGVKISKGGMARCPFHDDRDPSMKIDSRYHCFGCGADGDVIDFTAGLLGISKLEAAARLADDFGISYKQRRPSAGRVGKRIVNRGRPGRLPPKKKTLTERCLATQERFFRVLADYHHLLMSWKETEAPSGPEDEWNDRFCEALREISTVEFLMDEILEGTPEKKIDLMNCYREKVKEYESRLDRFTTGENEGV